MNSESTIPGLKAGRLLLFTTTIFILMVVMGFAFFNQLQAQEVKDDDPLPSETPTSSPTPTFTPTITNTPTVTITITVTPSLTPTMTPTPQGSRSTILFPAVFEARPNQLPSPIRISQDPPIDFESARQDAQSRGLDISYNKIGFHIGVGGNREGLDDWIVDMDAAGVPIVLKTANDAELIYKAQELSKVSGVPHVLIYRNANRALDTPNYNLAPRVAAEYYWQLNRDAFPPELDPEYVWIETVNELDKNQAAWIAEFSLETAKMAVADGYKYAALSWTTGEPELEHWESPEMLEFLRYAGEHPDDIAISLHEYSGETSNIGRLYPWLVGRFQKLFAICDKHEIPRPTVIITEWGWEAHHVPLPEDAMEDIAWASWLYAAYPEVLGAAIWYLGPDFESIADEAQKLIAPVGEFGLSTYYLINPGQWPIDETILAPSTSLNRKKNLFR